MLHAHETVSVMTSGVRPAHMTCVKRVSRASTVPKRAQRPPNAPVVNVLRVRQRRAYWLRVVRGVGPPCAPCAGSRSRAAAGRPVRGGWRCRCATSGRVYVRVAREVTQLRAAGDFLFKILSSRPTAQNHVAQHAERPSAYARGRVAPAGLDSALASARTAVCVVAQRARLHAPRPEPDATLHVRTPHRDGVPAPRHLLARDKRKFGRRQLGPRN